TLSAFSKAPNGHIVATSDVTPRPGGDITLALGFGRTQQAAVSTAGGTPRASLLAPFGLTQAAYELGWHLYDTKLHRPPAHLPGVADTDVAGHYYLSANVLKASEDKTFPGAIAASLASPWGQAVNAGTLVSGKPVYFGSYREVFSRDTYEVFTGLLADSDIATAQATT